MELSTDDPQPEAPPLAVTEGEETASEFGKAREAFGAGDIETCLALLRAAAADNPEHSSPRISLAGFYLAAGKYAEARATLEQSAREDPDDLRLYAALGQLALAEGRLSDADVHFEKALTMDAPTNWTPQQQRQFQAICYAGRAAVAEHRRHWSLALGPLKQLVQMQPDNVRLRERWARALFMAGRADKAFEQFDIAYQQDGSLNPPEVSMGARNVRVGNFSRANSWYERALEKYPNSGAIHFEYSVALMYQDRPDEAERHAARAAQLGVDSLALLLHSSQIARQQQDWKKAESLLATALEREPKSAVAQDLLALILIESSNQAKAGRSVELAEANAAKHPGSARLQGTLGWIYFRTGRAADAARLLREAAAQDDHPRTLFFAAQVLEKQGQPQETALLAARLRQKLQQPSVFPLRKQAQAWLNGFSKDE